MERDRILNIEFRILNYPKFLIPYSCMKIFIGADHGGFKLKEQLKVYLEEKWNVVVDCGAYTLDPKDDYPDFAIPVSRGVVKTRASRGVLICRSGLGMNIVANRFPKIFAVLTDNTKLLAMVREHEDVNVLCLASDFITVQKAKILIDVFLSTPFSGEARHLRRLKKIARIK